MLPNVENIEKVLTKIEYYKKERITKNVKIFNHIFAELKFLKNEQYGFAIFSVEKYNNPVKALNNYQYKHRYYYYEFLGKGKNDVLFIMFNPSSANIDKDDSTIKNCRKLAIKCKYQSMEIINIFSERNPNVNELSNNENEYNEIFIKCLLAQRKDIDIVVAWGFGKEEEYSEKINNINELIKNNPKYIITLNAKAIKRLKTQNHHPSPTAWGMFGGFDFAAKLSKM